VRGFLEEHAASMGADAFRRASERLAPDERTRLGKLRAAEK
jgi:hypothetical protein